MKKVVLLLVMSFALVFSNLMFAQDYVDEIIVNEEESQVEARSFGFKPRVFLDAQTQELTISFSSRFMDLYDVEVLDENGVVVSGPLVANGSVHTYDLSGLTEGYCTLRISNSSKSYSGSFWF